MDKPLYCKMLSRAERLGCIKAGMALKSMSNGDSKSDNVVEKTAQLGVADTIGKIGDLGIKGIVLASVVTGVPLGVMAHYMDNASKRKNLKNREREEELKYYREATDEIERSLAAGDLTF